MSDIGIATDERGRLAVTSPYDDTFVAEAKYIGGQWDRASRCWTFDPRDEERVRDLLREVYGTDGSPADQADLVTVRWNISNLGHTKGDNKIRLAGRTIVSRSGRDADVRLGEGVVLVSGGFPGSAGSMQYPAVAPEEGTVVEIRDLPRAAIEGVQHLTVVGETVDIDALKAKRERLLAELADIDRTLAEHGGATS
ncbi:type 2 periplasmic-binding domain-containing protein [Streptomyces salinarius]|uniref:hypothetical protein n=1 Tax=Streptomyces salinarius TaxID=2762598 RepID=UPI001647AA9E|nr:hypothetical protein [Streptomyces salinarius]